MNVVNNLFVIMWKPVLSYVRMYVLFKKTIFLYTNSK